jgi:hypothetical protein
MSTELPIIGRQERVHLPDFNLRFLPAKIDTGAYTSALHCTFVEEIPGTERIRFNLLDPSYELYPEKPFEFPIKDHRSIKNSFGQEAERYIIEAKLELMDSTFITEISLSDRSKLEFPLLLGRKALYLRFLVDVSHRNLWYRSKQKVGKKKKK